MACHYPCVTLNPLSHHSNSFDVLFEKYGCFIVARPLKHRLGNQPTFPAFISTSSSLIFAWKQCINELRFCGSFSLYFFVQKLCKPKPHSWPQRAPKHLRWIGTQTTSFIGWKKLGFRSTARGLKVGSFYIS